jgi:hypothetical protein
MGVKLGHVMDKVFDLPLPGPQEVQRHSAGHQKHHPCNIAEAGPSNYFVKPTEKVI